MAGIAADLGVSAIVSLAKSGYESCLLVKSNREDVARIAERLTWIIRKRDKWQHICSTQSHGNLTFDRLKKALEQINLVMEAVNKPKKTWRARVKEYMGAKGVSESISKAEQQLSSVLQDLHMEQSSALAHVITTEFKTMKELLERFGKAKSSTNAGKTNQQELDEALQEVLEGTSQLLVDGSATSITTDGDISVDGIQQVNYNPNQNELEALEIKLDDLQYEDNKSNLLGEGSFSEVFKGSYGGVPVAIKRLKIDLRELRVLSKRDVLRDAKRIATEALLANRCSVHPSIVEVLGFHVSLDMEDPNLERPLIVMERMHVTLYDVLHYQAKEHPLSFIEKLTMLHDMARALEFLHLQGIVHHDVKTLNILLNQDLSQAKLADFGEAKVKGLNTTRVHLSTILSTSGPSHKGVVAGTVAYQAPEILAEEVKESSRVSEMYSFGATVWECLTGQMPHRGKKESQITILAINKKDQPMLEMPEIPHLMDSFQRDAWR